MHFHRGPDSPFTAENVDFCLLVRIAKLENAYSSNSREEYTGSSSSSMPYLWARAFLTSCWNDSSTFMPSLEEVSAYSQFFSFAKVLASLMSLDLWGRSIFVIIRMMGMLSGSEW